MKKIHTNIAMLMEHVKHDEHGMILVVKIKPGAQTEQFRVNQAGELTLGVSALALKGAANERVRRILADIFGVAPSRVDILSGEHARVKRIRIRP